MAANRDTHNFRKCSHASVGLAPINLRVEPTQSFCRMELASVKLVYDVYVLY